MCVNEQTSKLLDPEKMAQQLRRPLLALMVCRSPGSSG